MRRCPRVAIESITYLLVFESKSATKACSLGRGGADEGSDVLGKQPHKLIAGLRVKLLQQRERAHDERSAVYRLSRAPTNQLA